MIDDKYEILDIRYYILDARCLDPWYKVFDTQVSQDDKYQILDIMLDSALDAKCLILDIYMIDDKSQMLDVTCKMLNFR